MVASLAFLTRASVILFVSLRILMIKCLLTRAMTCTLAIIIGHNDQCLGLMRRTSKHNICLHLIVSKQTEQDEWEWRFQFYLVVCSIILDFFIDSMHHRKILAYWPCTLLKRTSPAFSSLWIGIRHKIIFDCSFTISPFKLLSPWHYKVFKDTIRWRKAYPRESI